MLFLLQANKMLHSFNYTLVPLWNKPLHFRAIGKFSAAGFNSKVSNPSWRGRPSLGLMGHGGGVE
jgi:hypothetical protein